MTASDLTRAARVIPVLRGDTPDEVLSLARTLLEEGFNHLELTYTVPEVAGLIRELARSPCAVVGAGTVTTEGQLDEALAAGSSFIVSPGLDPDLAVKAKRAGVPFFPGVFTPSEVMTALGLGFSTLKLVPGSLGGIAYLKTLQGPFPQVEFMPTGGVGIDNLQDWAAAGAVAVGIGSSLTQGSLNEVRRRARVLKGVLKEVVWKA